MAAKNCLNCVCGTRIKYKTGDVISCYNEPGVTDHAFCISVAEAENHCCENFRDTPVVYELPAQTEVPKVISVPRAEMCSNALLFYDAFRGLCRLRIDYADQVINAAIADCDAYWTEEKAEKLEKTEMFWTKVQDYWKAKLELSYKWEKDYFGRQNNGKL